MPSPITFTPAASVATQITAPATTTPPVYAMPPADPSNLDTQVSVTNCLSAYIVFAPGALPGPSAPGTLVVQALKPALLLSNPITAAIGAQGGRQLAQCIGGPGDVYGTIAAAGQGVAAATATQFSAVTNPPGGTITITRGSTSAATTF